MARADDYLGLRDERSKLTLCSFRVMADRVGDTLYALCVDKAPLVAVRADPYYAAYDAESWHLLHSLGFNAGIYQGVRGAPLWPRLCYSFGALLRNWWQRRSQIGRR